MRPALSIQYGASRCVPWRGDFDRDDNPIHHGILFLPGKRLCGHRDCVNANHVELLDEEVREVPAVIEPGSLRKE
jgi:hypothetical protein